MILAVLGIVLYFGESLAFGTAFDQYKLTSETQSQVNLVTILVTLHFLVHLIVNDESEATIISKHGTVAEEVQQVTYG